MESANSRTRHGNVEERRKSNFIYFRLNIKGLKSWWYREHDNYWNFQILKTYSDRKPCSLEAFVGWYAYFPGYYYMM